ncbi:DUF4405 domain-containing protein [Aliiroseovarius marinus]|uniref:DUF4405 domain-containing protein n=1 Tax=Aliiroseovarius marinus TaxID=2500159 RepID=UPI00105BE244|nr:DUF4405 domain-containing protein [Aliiroseovarius marinus]
MSTLRKWATPLTVGSFLVMGVTGTLMFFHMNTMLGKVIHEWAGWLMLIGVGAHILLNWRALTTYFKRPLAMWIMGVGAALTVATMLPIGGAGEPPIRSMVMAVTQADEATLMALSGHDLQEGRMLLSEAGVELQPGQSLADATGGDFGLQSAAMSALFASGEDH